MYVDMRVYSEAETAKNTFRYVNLIDQLLYNSILVPCLL